MHKIIAFIMTHPDVTIEIKKDTNFHQSINIKMRKNNITQKSIVEENNLTELEALLIHMYAKISIKEQFQTTVTPNCSECEHYEEHHTNLACATCPVITKVWGAMNK